MHRGIGDQTTAILEAVSSVLGWAATTLLTTCVGFCLGYWIGHGAISATQTLHAFIMIPFLWLGFWQMFVAYGVTGLAFYLPLRYEAVSLKIVAITVNLLTWSVIIHSIVVATLHSKFWHF